MIVTSEPKRRKIEANSQPMMPPPSTTSRRGSGTGGQLMEALLARAKEQGHSAVSLSAEQGMTKLYERFGFRAVEEKDGTVTMRADLT